MDTDKKQVTVQAGCRVQQLVDALAPHGLTLQNFASIREQQIGGFMQVGSSLSSLSLQETACHYACIMVQGGNET